MAQLHKKFTDSQIKELIERYLSKEIERKYIQEILGIRKRRFFIIVKHYRENPDNFSIQYIRKTKTRKITQSAEKSYYKRAEDREKADSG